MRFIVLAISCAPGDVLMKNLLAYFSLGRTPDSRLNLSVAIGSTVVRQIISSTLYLLAMWITTRQLGPHNNGILATALLLPQTLFAFLNLGLGSGHVYQLSSGAGDYRRMRHANWTLAAVLWLAVLAALVLCTENSIATYLPRIDKDMALFASALFPMMLLATWSSSLIQGNRDYRLYNRIMLVQPAVFCLAIIVLYASNSVTVFSILCSYLLSQLSLWLLSETKINNFSSRSASGTGLVASLRFGLKAHASNIITFLNYRLALYLVSYMLGSEATGKYVLSIQLAEVLWLISSAASMVVFPESAAHSKSPAELRKMITKIAGSVFQITFAGAVLAAAAAPFAIPWVFGREYEGAVLPFIILLPGIVMWSYMSVISNSLAGMGHQKVNIVSALLCLSASVTGSFWAIPKFGVHGAALASTVAFSITTVFTMMMYMRITSKKSGTTA
ncbi:MAG: oligosaccharide flippase family protein [Telluria sp.]